MKPFGERSPGDNGQEVFGKQDGQISGVTILVIGSCGLDRLLTVPSYPNADEKIRTTAYHEVGGGNAANTASAMALLSNASFLSSRKIRVKLLTKIGDDRIGFQLSEELRQAGVDLSSPLFKKGQSGTTTGLTTIIVSENEHTRTCIHTPGTCGELTASDIETVDLDEVFNGVVHLHADARHTIAASILAQEARRRSIPVSVDAEKDRGTPFMDKLLESATIVFTDSQQLGGYIQRRNLELQEELSRKPLPDLSITVEEGDEPGGHAVFYANGIIPCHYFLRWYGASQSSKEVIITKGSMGALHVKCCTTHSEEASSWTTERINQVVVSARRQSSKVNVKHTVLDVLLEREQAFLSETEYEVRCCGILSQASIIDTTGAGDAFIGGYLITQLLCCTLNNEDKADSIHFGLQFGAWVAGKKLGGPGSRSALPSGSDVDELLGKEVNVIRQKIPSVLEPFGRDNTFL